MIRKLQYKFIGISTVAILIVMAALLILVNRMFYRNAVSEIYYALEFIAENDGELPEDFTTRMIHKYGDMTVELRYQLRYFSVWIGNDGTTIESVNLEHIYAVSEKEAGEFAKKALSLGRERGRMKGEDASYCYLVTDRDNMKLVVFMDYSRDLHTVEELRRFSIWFSLVCLGFFLIVISALSRRAIKPVIRNIENQKQFITNAGHELKTPLAIISANTEVLEMMEGENEWTRSTMNQVQRLSGLVNNLITLAKMGELEKEEVTQVDFSSLADAAASDFRLIAEQKNIKLEKSIEPELGVRGVESHLGELINILLDNAVKYCDEKGIVSVNLTKRTRHKGVAFTVSNTYSDGEKADCGQFFDRFYRGDISHNSEKAGYGIGLAMAEGFVKECKGKIAADFKDGVITFRVTLP